MSETPTPRLGRAVRYLAPVAAVAVLAVPSTAFAAPPAGKGWNAPDNGKEQGHGNASDDLQSDRNNGNGPGHKDKADKGPKGDKGPKDDKGGPKDDGDKGGPWTDCPADKNKGGGNDKHENCAPGGPTGPGGDKPGNDGKDGKDGKDGASGQSASPIVTAPAAPAAAPVATTIPSRSAYRCVSRRQVVITLGERSQIRSSSARVNGKRVKVRSKGGRLLTTIDLRTLPKGRYTISTRVVLKDGSVRTGVRRYKTCTVKELPAKKAKKGRTAKKG